MKKALATLFALLMMVGTVGMVGCNVDEGEMPEEYEENGDM